VLADELWRELLRLKATREVVEPLADSDPRYRRWIVVSEYRAQADLFNFSLTEGDVPVFFYDRGSDPVVELMQRQLEATLTLIDLLKTQAAHAPVAPNR
jgi:hypothetical protein